MSLFFVLVIPLSLLPLAVTKGGTWTLGAVFSAAYAVVALVRLQIRLPGLPVFGGNAPELTVAVNLAMFSLALQAVYGTVMILAGGAIASRLRGWKRRRLAIVLAAAGGAVYTLAFHARVATSVLAQYLCFLATPFLLGLLLYGPATSAGAAEPDPARRPS